MTEQTSTERADALDRAAGEAWRSGDHEKASFYITVAGGVDPDRAILWDQRLAQIRSTAQPADLTLAEQTARRLKAAGIGPEDPAMSKIRAWNKAVLNREAQ